MTIKEYVFGRRVRLVTSLGKGEVEDAVRRHVGGTFNPFHTGVAGWCQFNRIGLRWATAFWSNGFQPVFRGKLEAHGTGTSIDGRFGAPPVLLAFLGFWYSMLSMMAFTTIAAYVNDEFGEVDLFVMLPALIAFMFIPAIFHLLFNRSADSQFDDILEFLDRTGGFKVAADSRRH